MKKQITIAIDGFSACGKSTLAKALALKLGYSFIDSGAMYRGVALFSYRQGYVSREHLDEAEIIQSLNELRLNFRVVNGKNCLFLGDENIEDEIRKPHVAGVVSQVATLKKVRQKLVLQQQELGNNGGIVMDGRDIASVVFPNAQLKIFVTASPEIRAKRRFMELQLKGITQTIEEVSKNLSERDYADSNREESPLIQVSDALILDNTALTKEAQLEWALKKTLDLIGKNEP